MQQPMIEQFQKARQTSTPLIAIQTPDPAATIDAVRTLGDDTPMVQWDVCNGWRALNKKGGESISVALKDADPSAATVNPVEQLMAAKDLPENTILFVHNAHRFLSVSNDPASAGFAQAVWNLRDTFKLNGRTLVLLGPSFIFPSEIANDVLVLDEPLPNDTQLELIVNEIFESAESETKSSPEIIDALRGLAAFPAEQVVSMSLELNGGGKAVVNMTNLWERKRRMIESNRGLSVWRDGMKFADLGGLDAAKEFFLAYIAGKSRPNVIVFIDEIDKSSIVGGLGDTSGTSNDQLGVFLAEMQDNGWTGSIFFGHPGAGKTALAKAIGNEAGVPTIFFDMGAMKGSLVGESERYIRDGFKVIKAVGGDRVLFIATCNEFAPIKPELKRRFGLPTFFFDLLTDEERDPVRKIYCKRYEFNPALFAKIKDTEWTGAEIERCCRLAYDLDTTPDKTARYIIPVAQSSADDVARRRREADGRLLSASLDGLYRTFQIAVDEPRGARRVSLGKGMEGAAK